MTIWIDADACPVAIRDIVTRASQRVNIQSVFVANHVLRLPNHPSIRFIQVEKGYDVADNLIVQRVEDGDFVVTQDIPLAAELLDKCDVTAVNPRGERYTRETIKSQLTLRDFYETMRASGIESGGGPSAFSSADKQRFGNELDKWINKIRRK